MSTVNYGKFVQDLTVFGTELVVDGVGIGAVLGAGSQLLSLVKEAKTENCFQTLFKVPFALTEGAVMGGIGFGALMSSLFGATVITCSAGVLVAKITTVAFRAIAVCTVETVGAAGIGAIGLGFGVVGLITVDYILSNRKEFPM